MRLIKLTRGQLAIIDAADYERVSQHSWSYHPNGYAHAKINKKVISLHRFLLAEPRGIIDHKNGNGLDNRRCNLRIVTVLQNSRNRKPNKNRRYKGVGYDSRNGKWRARIRVNYRHLFLGYFLSEKEAARAYNRAALKYHGKFARLNEVNDYEQV